MLQEREQQLVVVEQELTEATATIHSLTAQLEQVGVIMCHSTDDVSCVACLDEVEYLAGELCGVRGVVVF